MLFRLDPKRSEPLYDQLAASVRRAIVRGEVGAGHRLPGARELADSLGVNVHTVLRGYQLLRDEGLLELRRGRGAVVTAQAVAGKAELTESIAAVRSVAHRLGLDAEELTALITEGY